MLFSVLAVSLVLKMAERSSRLLNLETLDICSGMPETLESGGTIYAARVILFQTKFLGVTIFLPNGEGLNYLLQSRLTLISVLVTIYPSTKWSFRLNSIEALFKVFPIQYNNISFENLVCSKLLGERVETLIHL